MVFHCRCLSFLLEEDKDLKQGEEIEEAEEIYETRTQAKSTTTFYTAASDSNWSVPTSHAKTSHVSSLVDKSSIRRVLTVNEEDTESISSVGSDLIQSVPNSQAKLSRLGDRTSNLRVFTVAELETATENFSRLLEIGEGGLMMVYKGMIKSLEHPFHDIQVAVKIPTISLQGHKEWETVTNVLGVVEHPKLVKLIGYGVEDNELLLVYEYMVNGSLRDHLYARSKTPLSWAMRVKVLQDIASGLTYLHEQIDTQIIVGDFNSSNIFLDDHWNAKLFDFGWAQLRPQEGRSHVCTTFTGLGTEGYIAPEGPHTSKSDVWSYGVFIYELITGRRPLDWDLPANKRVLLKWVRPCLESKRFHQIVDPRLEGNYPLQSAEKLCIIADKCLSANPKSRPKMSEVLEMLNQHITVPSQATTSESPQTPKVAVDSNKAFGPNQGAKTNVETKHEGQNGSMKIQVNKPACLPRIRPLKLLKSCSKKGCCVSLH